jgi:hypothetical protein
MVIFFPLENKSVKFKSHENENYYNDAFCSSLGGKREVKYDYKYGTKQSFIKVDCETENYVFEGGLDKRSSLDSIQQAIFLSTLADKRPAIVIFDTDNTYGMYEHRLKTVADSVGVKFKWVKNEALEAWFK